MRRTISLTLVSLFLSLVGGRLFAGESGDTVRGKEIYSKNCAACHGYKGDGRSPAAQSLYPRPRDFTRGIFKFRSTPDGMVPTDEDLFRSVSNGIPLSSMPAWKYFLTEQEIWDAVAYVKTFSDRFQREVPRPIVVPPEPPLTEETVARGRELYHKLVCVQCHGVKGQGNGPRAKKLKDAWGNRIKPRDHTRGIYKGGFANSDLYRRVSNGIGGTPMPTFAEELKPEEIWSLIHYIKKVFVKGVFVRKKNVWDYLVRDDPSIPQ